MTTIWIVVLASLATVLTRIIPYFLGKRFSKNRILDDLSKVLPTASFALLVVYAFQDVSLGSVSSYLPALVSAIVVVAISWKTENFLLSIFVGSGIYIFIVNLIV